MLFLFCCVTEVSSEYLATFLANRDSCVSHQPFCQPRPLTLMVSRFRINRLIGRDIFSIADSHWLPCIKGHCVVMLSAEWWETWGWQLSICTIDSQWNCSSIAVKYTWVSSNGQNTAHIGIFSSFYIFMFFFITLIFFLWILVIVRCDWFYCAFVVLLYSYTVECVESAFLIFIKTSFFLYWNQMQPFIQLSLAPIWIWLSDVRQEFKLCDSLSIWFSFVIVVYFSVLEFFLW